MYRRIVHGLLVASLMLTGCQHEFWHISLPENPISKPADHFARWLQRHPQRWMNHHQQLIDGVAEGVGTAILVGGLLYAGYLDVKKNGPNDIISLFSDD